MSPGSPFGASDRVLDNPQHPYTQQLLEAHRGLGEGDELSYPEGKTA